MRRILIALNDGGSAKILKERLDSPEYKIYVSASFEEAMDIYKAEQPDLVIAELALSPSGGDSLCLNIKQSFPDNNTFVILACGSTAAELKKCGRSGADSYVRTPIDPDDISRRVNSILQKTEWRAPRVLVKVRVETSYRSDEFFCTSRNLSNTGILLETEKSLARGDTINCSFFLPDVERIRTDCLIIRIERAKEGKYTYGAEFIELDEHQSKQISEFISREREVGNII